MRSMLKHAAKETRKGERHLARRIPRHNARPNHPKMGAEEGGSRHLDWWIETPGLTLQNAWGFDEFQGLDPGQRWEKQRNRKIENVSIHGVCMGERTWTEGCGLIKLLPCEDSRSMVNC